mgnify:CR=1 FL=1
MISMQSVNSEQSAGRIQRRFRDLARSELTDIEQNFIPADHGWSRDFGWCELLKSRRVLLISEAGAGKTHECRKQVLELWNRGEPAFYFDLAQLAQNSFEDLLSSEEEARFNAWRASQSEVATCFLDSIDELNLTLGSFELALKRLNKAISGQLGRVRVVITTRPVQVDQNLIHQYLPIPDPVDLIESADAFADIAMGRSKDRNNRAEKDSTPPWRIVTLMPLSKEQIHEMAELEGVEDPDALLNDIYQRDAAEFARRPQDLVELCSDWRDFHRIRTHKEQVEHNINIKLKPRASGPELSELSPDRALEGASRLALAALLTRKLTIRHSVEADFGGEPGTALDPATVLHDWTPEERKTLLQRALFGFASYGRVRFHHRSVIEFLAAYRLENRLANGMTIKAVKRLLFATPPLGSMVIRPTMRPVAAWLARADPSIFRDVCNHEPSVLLNHADPECMSPGERIEALRAYVERYGKGGWRGVHFPKIQVRRFASTELANEVPVLWNSQIENVEVRELLLELIGAGSMSSCSDIAYEVAIDDSSMSRERLAAIDALAQLNDPRLTDIARSLEEKQRIWPERLVRGIIIELFPNFIDPERLCRILGSLQETNRAIGEIEWMLPLSIEHSPLTLNYLTDMRSRLTALVTEELFWEERSLHLVCKRPHLVPLLSAVCLRLLADRDTDEEVVRSSAIALRLQSDQQAPDEPAKELRKAIRNASPSVREAAFWADDAFIERLIPGRSAWDRMVDALQHGPFPLEFEKDETWILRTLSDQNELNDKRSIMLEASIWLSGGQDHDSQKYIEQLKEKVVDAPDLVGRIEQRLKPNPTNPKQIELEAKIRRQREENEQIQAKHHAQWVDFWTEVAERPEEVFNPDRANNTAWILWQAMKRSGDESRSSGWNRRFIEQHFGEKVANQLRDTMTKIWREDKPTLRMERPYEEKNTFLVRWQLGLAGVTAEAEDPDWARRISRKEAELAARYAPIEINGFPSWLESLSLEHPEEVKSTLGPDLVAQLEEPAKPSTFYTLLQDVSHSQPPVAKLFVPFLINWLDRNKGVLQEGEDETSAAHRLKRVIDLLLEHGEQKLHSYIKNMAIEKLESQKEGQLTTLWLSTLMNLDPGKAACAMEQRLAAAEPAPNDLAVHYFGNLFGPRYGGEFAVNLKKVEFTPDLLLRLIRLAYNHIRPADDVEHEGVFTPGPRDQAQDGRSALLSALLDMSGEDSWAKKLEMYTDPLFEHFRDRLLLLAEEKLAEQMDETELKERDVIAIDRHGETPPMTCDEMFSLMLDRLDDLDDFLLQDTSPREVWAQIGDERVMRREIARRLKDDSNGTYTVDQEAATADEKETDIRMRSTGSRQQAVIELKIGESWSGRELRDTLKNQIVKKYMAPEDCRSGCLLITVVSNRAWEDPESGERLDIDQLATMLHTEAHRIMGQMGESLRLSAKVLDLRPRLPIER